MNRIFDDIIYPAFIIIIVYALLTIGVIFLFQLIIPEDPNALIRQEIHKIREDNLKILQEIWKIQINDRQKLEKLHQEIKEFNRVLQQKYGENK